MKRAMYMVGLTVGCMALLSGCIGSSSSSSSGGSGGGGDEQDDDARVQQLNATDNEHYVYFNLDTGETVELTGEQALESTEWHLAFRRYAIALNGGTSGPGNVEGALVADQGHFYDENGEPNASVFTNASAESELTALMGEFDEPADNDWVADAFTTVLSGPSSTDGGWYTYEFSTGNFLPNPDNGWLLRSGGGDSYARMRMTELDFPSREGNGVKHFAFEFDVQPANTVQFGATATFTGSIPPEGGDVCFDFDTDQTVDCSGTAWDLMIGFQGRDFYLRSNGGVSGDGDGAAFGPFPWDELSTYTSATMDPSGQNLAGLYVADSSAGIFEEYSWYAYDLTGQHRLWPNYRVYLIDTDRDDESAPRYALQVINYYSDSGASGHPEIRWRLVE